MFHALCMPALRRRFPAVRFFFLCYNGQEAIWGRVSPNEFDYDLFVDLVFPCAEWDGTNETKAEKCLRVELGLADERRGEDYRLEQEYASPLVGMHTHSTCLPHMLDCPATFTQRLWTQFVEEGLVPFDTYMRRPDSNGVALLPFQTRKVTDIPATIPKLMGIMRTLCGMASVSSGNFFAALSVLPPRKVLFLRTNFPAVKLTRLPVWEIDTRKSYDSVLIHDFCDNLKNN